MKQTMEITQERFAVLADAYGARIDSWPAGERQAARALLAGSPRARATLEEARLLDEMLARLDVPAPSDALVARVLGDAADAAAVRHREGAARPGAARRGGSLRDWFGGFGWRPAGALAACAMIGFLAGWSGEASLVADEAETLARADDGAEAFLFAEAGDGFLFDETLL